MSAKTKRKAPAPPESWATIASTDWWAAAAAKALREAGIAAAPSTGRPEAILEPLFARAIAAARLDENRVARRIVDGAVEQDEALAELDLRATFLKAGRR